MKHVMREKHQDIEMFENKTGTRSIQDYYRQMPTDQIDLPLQQEEDVLLDENNIYEASNPYLDRSIS